MRPISFKRHRFPADAIRHAVWLYFRFTLSFRDVEEMMAQRGIQLSYETVRCWTIKFGPQFARALRRRRGVPSARWHLDEMVCNVGGRQMYLWRAVDDEGEVLDLVMQRHRDTDAALKLLKRLLRNATASSAPSCIASIKAPNPIAAASRPREAKLDAKETTATGSKPID
jgi:putative transposase